MLSWLLRQMVRATRRRSAQRSASPLPLLVVLVLRPAPGSSVMVVRLVHAPHPTLTLLLVRTRQRSAQRSASPLPLLVVLVLRPAPGSSVMVVRLVHAPHPTLTLLLDRSPLLSLRLILSLSLLLAACL